MTSQHKNTVQYSDQMHCKDCDQTWDMNDPFPPPCQKSGIPSCPKCGSRMLQTETFRLKCGVCEERELMARAMQQFHSGLNSGRKECCDWQQREYRVTWAIDVTADSPEDAVRQVWEQYFQQGHTATVFEVQEFDNPDSEMVDVGSPV